LELAGRLILAFLFATLISDRFDDGQYKNDNDGANSKPNGHTLADLGPGPVERMQKLGG